MTDGWNWETFNDAFPFVVKGIGMTLGLTIGCYIFALLFGFFWLFIRRVPIRPISWLFTWIMEFIRSTPPIVQLFFLYYGWHTVPYVGAQLPSFTCAVIALGLHFSTYISEVYRSGIDNVDKGQWEAARALNFPTRMKWTKIILPQALPPMIPMLGNYLIILFKEVPLAATIGVVGIMHLAQDYGDQYWNYLEPLTIVALLFLVLSSLSSLLISWLERRMNFKFEKKKAIA